MRINLIVKLMVLGLFVSCLGGCAHSIEKSSPVDLADLMIEKNTKSGITEDQSVHLDQFLYRHSAIKSAADYFIQDADYPYARTINDAVNIQKKYIENNNDKKENDIKIYRDLKSKFFQNIQTIKKALVVSFVDKKISVDAEGDQRIILTLWMKNNSGKDIVKAEGSLVVLANDGNEISRFKIINHQLIRNGNSSFWKGSVSIGMDVNGLVNEKLSKISLDDFKSVWVPEVIIFSDKSRLVVADN